MLSGLRFTVVGLFCVLAVNCKTANHTDSQSKAIEGVESGGYNTAGQATFVVTCAKNWINVMGDKQSDKVTITEDDFNAGNVTKRYCTTPDPSTQSGHDSHDGGHGGVGGGGAGPQSGLASIRKGSYTKSDGNLPCHIASFAPVMQLGVLKEVTFNCAQSTANGTYQCSDIVTCKKTSGDTIVFYDDHFEVDSGTFIGNFAINAAVLPSYKFDLYQADRCDGEQAMPSIMVSGKSIDDYTASGLTDWCNTFAFPPCANHIWGQVFNGAGCENINDYNCDINQVRKWCVDHVIPTVVPVFQQWANSP